MSIFSAMAEGIYKLKRGKVWCQTCGYSMSVDSAECLQSGWPKCCGHTMTVDSPEERAALKAREKTG